MRASAVRDCLQVLQAFDVDPQKGAAIDVGGTAEVYLSDDGIVGIEANPLTKLIPHLTLLDRGFNETELGTSSDEKVDFLVPESIEHLRNGFDIVFSFDTLEHVSNPFKFCEHLLRVAKPGGYVYVSTIFSWVYHPSPEDYFRFSPAGLEACFAEAAEGGVLWSGWESDERGVAVLAYKGDLAQVKHLDVTLRTEATAPGLLPPLPGPPKRKSILDRVRLLVGR